MQLQSRPKCRGGQTESPAWPGSLRRASLCAGRRFQGRSSPAPSPSPSQPELAAPTLSRVTVRSSLAEAADAASRHAATTTTPSPPNSQPASPAEPPETVTRHNFAAALPVIRAAIRDATFVAIDAEFTGLSPEGNGGEELLDDYEERYRRIANAASSFVIGQFGISAFKWVPPTSSSGSRGGGGGGVGHWEARTFNVYVFPRPLDGLGLDRRFMCQASSLTYLAEQGFDFNKMIRDGVGYLPLSYRDAKAAGLAEQADNQARSSELKGEEEEVLAEETRRVVREWLMGGEAELQVKLPPTRRLRTLQRLLVQQEFQLPSAGWQPFSLEEFYPLGPTAAAAAAAAAPSQPQGISSVGSSSALDGEEDGPGGGGSSSGDDEDGAGGDGSSSRERRGQAAAAAAAAAGVAGGAGGQLPPLEGYLVLRRLASWRPEELAAAGLQITAKQRLELLAEQTGFSLVIEALRESRRPVVAHNAMLDLSYLLAQFVESPPPRSWAAAKAALARALPGGLYDTKHVAAALAAQYGLPYGGDTGLGSLYGYLMDEAWLRRHVPGVAGLPYLGLGGGGGGGAGGLGEGVPAVRHAPGYVAYADVADRSKAHEAGFDAFMTGCVFARLLRIAEAKAAGAAAATGAASSTHSSSSSSNGGGNGAGEVGSSDEDEAAAGGGGADRHADGAGPSDAAASTSGSSSSSSSHDASAALLQPLVPYRGRVYIMRSDLPYYDVYGTDPVASRPAVVHVAGFTPATRYSYLQQRFDAAGLGPVQVCMLPAASGSGSGGAFVQLSRPELVSRALAAARKRWVGWTVMTYAEYAASRRQKSGGGNGSGAGGGAAGAGAKADAGRASPRLIGGQRAAAAVAGGVTAAAAPGGSVGGVEATGGAAAAATGRAAEAVGASEGAAAGTSAAGAGKAVGGLDSERKRLKAFTRRVAAVSAGLPPAPPTAPAAPEDGVEKQEAEAAGVAAAVAAAAASESGSASSATVADAAAAAQAAAKQAAEAEAEAARQAAEKLYSLARAAEKLRGGLGAGAGQDGSGSSSGGGSSSSSGGSGAALGLQRPGRPGRKL